MECLYSIQISVQKKKTLDIQPKKPQMLIDAANGERNVKASVKTFFYSCELRILQVFAFNDEMTCAQSVCRNEAYVGQAMVETSIFTVGTISLLILIIQAVYYLSINYIIILFSV